MVAAYIPAMTGRRSIQIVSQQTPPIPLVGGRRTAAPAKELTRRGYRVAVLTSLAWGAGAVPHDTMSRRDDELLEHWRS
jgi:hypothetical protein